MTAHTDPIFDGLHRMVVEAPADDGPRLVLADRLEEEGDSDRAEFIRLQIELSETVVRLGEIRRGEGNAKIPRSRAVCREWNKLSTREANLRTRESALLKLHAVTWSGPLRAVLPKCERCRGEGCADSKAARGGCRGTGLAARLRLAWNRGFVSEILGDKCHGCNGTGTYGEFGHTVTHEPCRGSGRIGGVDVTAWVGAECGQCSGHGVFIDYPEDEQPTCHVCHGPGRLPCLAAAVARLTPLTGVEFAGKRPYQIRDGGAWRWWAVENDADQSLEWTGPKPVIPVAIYEYLRLPQPFPTAAAAMLALSDAGVRFAREVAGLPELNLYQSGRNCRQTESIP